MGVLSASVDAVASKATASGTSPPPGAAASWAAGGTSVVNDQVGAAPVIWLPARSFALIVRVYFVAYASGAFGVIVAVNVVLLYVTFDGTAVTPSVKVYVIDDDWTASLKVAVGAVDLGRSTAPFFGVVDTTVGGV